MTTTPSHQTSTISSADLTASLEIIELKPGLRFSRQVLIDLLPDIETTLFFAKVYDLNAQQLGSLLARVHNSNVVQALTGDAGYHSEDLQDYVIDLTQQLPGVEEGDLSFGKKPPPKGEILPHMWDMLKVEVASSIKDVAAKLHSTIGLLPGKEGSMVFRQLAQVNARRPLIGDYRAQIHHAPAAPNLLVCDVSGSMSQDTVTTICDDVVGLGYKANAHLAIVSDTTIHWEPGGYSTEAVLSEAQYRGTHYETLHELLDRDWGVVISVADYDSSPDAKARLARCSGNIEQLLDVSLVPRPTFLAECLGQRAQKVRPLLTAARSLCHGW